MIFFVWFICFFISCDPVWSISGRDAYEDLLFLIRKIEEIHPLSIDKLPAKVIAAFNTEIKKLSFSQNKIKIWRAANRILRELHDANSQVFPKKAAQKKSPNSFELYGGTAYIIRGHYRYRIIKINNRTISQLYDEARFTLPYDNVHGLRTSFAESLSYKGYLKLYQAENLDCLRYEYLKGGIKKRVEVPFVDMPTLEPQEFIDFDLYPSKRIAVLTVRKCRSDNETKRLLYRFFKDIKKHHISDIIIDIRTCSKGGDSFSEEFLRYVSVPSSFRRYTFIERSLPDGIIRDKNIPIDSYEVPRLRSKTGTLEGNESFSLPTSQEFSSQNHNQTWRGYTADEIKDIQFSGHIYILTSPMTRNAATRFAALLHDNKMATLIGGSCGSNPSNFGRKIVFELPHTGMILVLTSKAYFRPDQSKRLENSLDPDIPIPWSHAFKYCFLALQENTKDRTSLHAYPAQKERLLRMHASHAASKTYATSK